MDVTGPTDCGNSPKNLLLAGWETALALGDWDQVADALDDGVVLEVAERGELVRITGRGAAIERLRGTRGDLTNATVDAAISHGKEGAAWGSWTGPTGTIQFAHAFRFATAAGKRLAWVRVVGA